jgi:hypothetical protein
MTYTEEFLKKVVQAGTLGYPLSKILNVLEVDDVRLFTSDFYDQNSEVFKHYKKGLDKSDFLLDSMLFDRAREGDLKAFDKFEERKKRNLVELEKQRRER